MNKLMNKENQLNEILQLVSFKIENEEFGLEITKVHEIIRFQNITQIPNTANFIEGIINLRGKVIPVINLRIKMGFDKKENDSYSRIIVIEVNSRKVGFIVDKVEEVVRISKDIIEYTSEIIHGINSDFIKAVAKMETKLLILLDIEKVLSEDEVSTLQEL